MIDAPHLNDFVVFFNMASPRPGPWPAKIIAINKDHTLDLEVLKGTERSKEFGVLQRNMAESGRLWDWPKDKPN